MTHFSKTYHWPSVFQPNLTTASIGFFFFYYNHVSLLPPIPSALRSCVTLFHNQIHFMQYFASIAFIYCIVILHQCGLSPALWKDPLKSPVAVSHSWSHLLWSFPLQSHQLYSDHFLSSSLAFPVAP